MSILEPNSADDGLPKRNLRTCGRYIGELTAPERVIQRAASTPAIPSRYVTTIFKGHREYLGFGSHALRFDSASQSHAPGPGEYKPPKSFLQDCLEKECWGKRGTGSFASRSVRMGPRSVPAMPPAGRGVPGPGKYEDQAAVSAVKSGKDFSKAEVSGVFARPTDKSVAHPCPAAPAQPGPGQYDSLAHALATQNTAVCASFRSKSSQRGDEKIAASEFPGPGEYQDESKSSFRGTDNPAFSAARAQGAYSAAFKAPSRLRIVSVHPDLPTVDHARREILGNFANVVARECVGTNGLAIAMPGPGAYNQNRDAMFTNASVGAKGSSSFLEGPKRVDWAAGDVADMPGPGRYEPKRVDYADRLISAASAFDSATERNKLAPSHAPGPAYYAPRVPDEKKSFRAKVADMWVPSQ